MKVNVQVCIDVDPELWDLAYGTGTSAVAVRKDVRSAVMAAIWGHPAVEEGGIRSVELR